MDRALKERIIGAIVLVVFVVLIVPIFLDGPPSGDEILSEAVALPGQSAQKMQTQVLNRDRETPVPEPAQKEPVQKEPVGAASSRDQSGQDAPPTESGQDAPPTVAEPEKEPVGAASSRESGQDATPTTTEPVGAASSRESEPDATPTSATGLWAVQLGSFSDQVNAEKLAAELRKQGFLAVLSKLDTEKGRLHRVRIGPQADRPAAEAVVRKLAAAGHKGQVVPHP